MAGARYLHVVFLVSGIAALQYQIIWRRLLMFSLGSDAYAVTIVVAAFMAGLGLGSVAGGHLADRLSVRGRWLAFAASEAAVAAFGIASPSILYGFLYVHLGLVPLGPATVGGLVFTVLLWPTVFMGMALPLLAAAFAPAEPPSMWIARLYGWNTIGAAIGAFTTTNLLLRTMDLTQGLQVAAGLNLACAVYVGVAARSVRSRSPSGAAPRPIADEPTPFGLPVWLVAFGLSGFVALSLEMLWFRVLGVIIKANAFTWGTLLAEYLLGLGIGALLATHPRLRSRSPGRRFLLLQAGAAFYAVASLALLVALVGRLELTRGLWHRLAYDAPMYPSASVREVIVLYGLVPIYLMGPTTLMLGLSFGALQQAVQRDLSRVGRRVGWLQAANVTGALAGTLVTGLFVLHWTGTPGGLRLVAALGGIFLVLFGAATPRRPRGRYALTFGGLALVATTGAVALVPSPTRLWSTLHGTHDETIIAEDQSGVALVRRRADGATAMYVDGIGMSALPDNDIHTVMGALPALMHPGPETVAVIGLASGSTLFGLGARAETRTMTSIEIVAPELTALRRLDERHAFATVASVLRDPRIHFVFADGRAFLRQTLTRFDIAVTDPLAAYQAFAGNIHSVEFFDLVRRRLTSNGLAVIWPPTPRVRRTFVAVFPYVLEFGDDLLIGSNDPIPFDPQTIKRRLADPFTRGYFAAGRIEIGARLEPYLQRPPTAYDPQSDRSGLGDVNRDLYAKDEFLVGE